eukprot:CAMPEP_0119037246 /NCGR_PEP_ID=MMETSP1177-20130426/5499_1 /TAXON_ID=2985 /ORGANISM="Ochromonas sp, Strain CCMP1899" /LENGTH=54 /DNA_ID=CAMNT_0006998263 /DNA_START=681 /DNA_END=842 /DNA_ORIENTATION=-
MVLTDVQKAQVRTAIESAKTREEIDVIEKHLKAGSLEFLDKIIPAEGVTVEPLG